MGKYFHISFFYYYFTQKRKLARNKMFYLVY